jgi:predicted ATP-grasp superfamily ATP-dependent carboligase
MDDQVHLAPLSAPATDGMPKAIVLGGGTNGLSAVRSLAQAGLSPIIVVDSPGDFAAATRLAQRHVVTTFNGEPFIDEMVRLQKDLPQEGILICSDDVPLLTLSCYRDCLAPYFKFQLPPHELLSSLTLKESFFQLAQRGGFPVPGTLLLRDYGDVGLLRDLRPPLCVKPNGRSPAYDNSFLKAYRVESHAEARILCERVLDAVGQVIVQEWIEGPNDSIYFSLCYMGQPNPVAFTGRKGRSWPPQVGVTASCWAAPEVAEELECLTLQFFQNIGVTTGFASMEYKRDQRDGRFLMVEPTVGRTDGQVEISALCGVNLCHIAYCDLAGLPRPPLRLDPTHVWRDEFKDFISARLLGTSCSYPPGSRIHNTFLRWNDPAPALLVAARGIKRMTKAFRVWETGRHFRMFN